jgi:hypothetical protein
MAWNLPCELLTYSRDTFETGSRQGQVQGRPRYGEWASRASGPEEAVFDRLMLRPVVVNALQLRGVALAPSSRHAYPKKMEKST